MEFVSVSNEIMREMFFRGKGDKLKILGRGGGGGIATMIPPLRQSLARARQNLNRA